MKGDHFTSISDEHNIELVWQAYDAFRRGDIAGVLETLSENIEWFILGPEEVIRFAGSRRGHQKVSEFFRELAETQTAERFEPLEFIAGTAK